MFVTRPKFIEIKSSTVKYSKNVCCFEYFLTYFAIIFIENSDFQKDCQIHGVCLKSSMGGGYTHSCTLHGVLIVLFNSFHGCACSKDNYLYPLFIVQGQGAYI